MTFCKNLYISKSIENENYNVDEIKKMLLENTSVLGIYLICINKKDKNTAEIFKCSEIFSIANRHKSYIVIGIAKSKIDAENLFSEILQDFINAGKNIDYFKEILINSDLSAQC